MFTSSIFLVYNSAVGAIQKNWLKLDQNKSVLSTSLIFVCRHLKELAKNKNILSKSSMFVVYKLAVIKRIGQSWTKIKMYCPNLQYL